MQRVARRWLGATALASPVALAGCGSSPGSPRFSPSSATTSAGRWWISALRPVGPKGAWAWLDQASNDSVLSPYSEEIALTLDGGDSWLVRTPPGLAIGTSDRSIAQLAAVSTADAWVTYAGVSSNSPQTLVATTNGGRQWNVQGRLPSPNCTMQFLTAKVGWCVTTLGAMGSDAVTIYRTADGGQNWTLESASASPQHSGTPGSLPVGCDKYVAFTAPTVGWAAFICPVGLSPIYESDDAGRTWSRQSAAALPARYRHGSAGDDFWTAAPVAVGAIGAVGLNVEAAGPRTLVYRTTNAGRTWSPVSPPGTPRQWSVDIVTPTTWKLSFGTTVLTTTDAGLSWRTVTSNLALPVQAGPQYVTANDGWYATYGQRTLYRTNTGGASWKLVRLPPFRSPTASPSATSSPTVTSPATCSAAYLTAKQGGGDSGAGHQVWVILLTNHSSAPCAIDGTPQVTLEGQSRTVMATHQTDGNFGLPDVSATASTVVIPSGGNASFVLGFLDNGLTTADCPQAAQLAIALPGGAGTVTAATDLAPCHGDFTVSPILPNVTAP